MTKSKKIFIAYDLLCLSMNMRNISKKMRDEWPDKAKEMAGAAKIARGWYEGIREEIESEGS